MLLFTAACSDYEVTPKDPEAEPGQNCQEVPEAPGVAIDETCLNEPAIGSFTPVIEWQWNTNTVDAGYDDIMSTPAVAHLTDDDADGTIGSDGDVPDVVFTTFSGGAYTSPGALVAVSGDGSGQLWSVTAPGGYTVYSSGSPAIGDLEGDGRPEICTAGVSTAVVCVRNDGSYALAGGTSTSYVGAPALADLEGDGDGEIVFGNQVIDHTGLLVWQGSAGAGYTMSFPVDMDGDGRMEVVAGNTVYADDGTVLWTAAGAGDGIAAVGDFDLDGDPEVVDVYGGTVSLLDDGVVLWQTAIPGGGSGGPPTVADFDGDGAPEVGVAALAYYSLFETDGSVRWSMPVSDYSSSVTGSSVFDFEADGAAEVVYADEHTLWVFDGATGGIKLQETGHASGTLFEYPLVVDVDGDGQTEIVVASNNYAYEGWNGITVFGDADQSWAESRPVWNQLAYHITNVGDDASLPLDEAPNWQSWNNFRAAGLEVGPSHWLANLQVDTTLCLDDCALDEAKVWITVSNAGLVSAPATELQLVRADGTVVWTSTTGTLTPGAQAVIGPVTVLRVEWGGGLSARIDPDAAVDECAEEDNVSSLGAWPCSDAE